jgi:peroxidase
MTMTGGAGADTFIFDSGNLTGQHNTAVITDYDPKVDKLQLPPNDGFAAVRVSSDHHGGTLLYLRNETIDLLGVNPNQLHHHDWA